MEKWWYNYMMNYDNNIKEQLLNYKNQNKTKMKKETRGRKALPAKEKKQPLYIMVKQKFIKEVNPKLKELEREYSTK
jgi:hypothetical protein